MHRNYLMAAFLAAGTFACSQHECTSSSCGSAAGKGMLSSSVETEKGRDESFVMESNATVQGIDYTTRVVTLRTADNRVIQFKAGPEVKRLNEIKVGDTVVAQYYVNLSFEVRPPTAAERANPTVMRQAAERATMNEAPGAASARVVHTIVTVTNLDRTAKTVTVRDPAGKVATVKAQNMERFNKLRVGDTVAVTYTEAIGISVDKN